MDETKREFNFPDSTIIEDFEQAMIGKIFSKIELGKTKHSENDCLVFTTNDGEIFYMKHDQDCCERVELIDVCGNFDYLINLPIVKAIEVHSEKGDLGIEEWTFYHLSTIKGTVSLRWYGTSNGFYGTSVTLYKVSV